MTSTSSKRAIAERMGISRPAVSEMIKRLELEGLVEIDGKIRLTAEGRTLAEQVVRRHRLAERFLTDILQLSWAEAHHEAGKWEHVMSEAVEQAISRVLGAPTTCRTATRSPGRATPPLTRIPSPGWRSATRSPSAASPKSSSSPPGCSSSSKGSAITPGRAGTITAASPDGTVTVEIEGHTVGVGAFASERILVTA